ncbi:MAG: hypothetical protein AB1567_05955, partial [bacterium]
MQKYLLVLFFLLVTTYCFSASSDQPIIGTTNSHCFIWDGASWIKMKGDSSGNVDVNINSPLSIGMLPTHPYLGCTMYATITTSAKTNEKIISKQTGKTT